MKRVNRSRKRLKKSMKFSEFSEKIDITEYIKNCKDVAEKIVQNESREIIKILMLDNSDDKDFYRSCKNISGLNIIPAKQVNAYQVLSNDWIVATKESVGQLLEVFK